jgi:hypothetical protein
LNAEPPQILCQVIRPLLQRPVRHSAIAGHDRHGFWRHRGTVGYELVNTLGF